MEKQQCLGGVVDTKYAAPMPVIGLYISTATLVLLLLMICDVFHGYRRKKPWLPCEFFSLNSLTLSLLAISTKLPFDLTTPMPSPQDQLSKLCGTTFICISMGFFLPSVLDMEGSELFVNMASLTILVVTVIVNTCIQMATGLIFSVFFIEHIIILILMCLILIIMWYFTLYSSFLANAIRLRGDWGKGYDEGLSYRGRLELIYENVAMYNYQVRVCSIAHCPAVGLLCTISPLVFLEVAFRTFFLKQLRFCEGVSDYKWSVLIVLVSQIITIALGTLAITFRWFSVASQMNHYKPEPEENISWNKWSCNQFKAFEVFSKLLLNWKMYSGIMKKCQVEDIVIRVLFATAIGLTWTNKVVIFLTWAMRKLISKRNGTDYLGENATADLTSWSKKCREDEPRRLIHLLSRSHPSQESRSIEGTNNCLLLVILVRLSDILLPLEFSRPLVEALDEAFSIIYFLDKRLDSMGCSNMFKRRLAKNLWKTRDISNHWFQKTVVNPVQLKYPQVKNISFNTAESHSQFVPNHPLQVIKEIGQLLNCPLFFDSDERLIIKDFIEDGRHGTFKELYERMEQLFVDKVSLFLTELPSVALEYVFQSPARKLDKRMRIALQFMYKFEQLQSQVQWLSVGSNNVTGKRSADGIEPMDGNNAAVCAPSGTVDVNTHVLHVAIGDEIIEVHE